MSVVCEDVELEYRINHQILLLRTALTPAERRAAWDELKRLHGLRTPDRVREMEEDAGLAR
jgi:hypothetical protein